MSGFAQYYVQFLSDLWSNICEWFVMHISIIVKVFKGDWYDNGGYFSKLTDVVSKWNALDYIAFILVLIINIGFIGLLVVLLFQLIKRYVKFVKREVDKDSLIEEVSLLNQKVVELIDEKNKILAMRVSQIGAGGQGMVDYEGQSGKKKGENESRFSKLIQVDQFAAENPRITVMNQSDMIDFSDLVDRFINYSASQLHLYYTRDIIARFFAGMGTTKLMILEGISGTGKTSLPYAMGKFFQNDTSIISVQPSWRDRAELLGYLNEFTKRFNETDFLRSVYEASYSDTINFIVLDEMNLARVEYYFAEFLSVMEMPDPNEWKIDIVPVSEPRDPKNLINGKILIAQNIWFVGTANKDDSTFTITDKVYDRAITIDFTNRNDEFEPEYAEKNIRISNSKLNQLFDDALSNSDNLLTENDFTKFLTITDKIYEEFDIPFGNRILNQMKTLVPVYVACGGTKEEALDFLLTRKVLSKLDGRFEDYVKTALKNLLELLAQVYGAEVFVRSEEAINRLIRRL